MSFPTLANTPMVCGLGRGNRSKSVASVGASTSVTAAGYFGAMRSLKVRSRVGLAFMALLLSGCADACEEEVDWLSLEWGMSAGPSNSCEQKLLVEFGDEDGPDLDFALRIDVNETFDDVDHSSEFVTTSETTGHFDLIVGDTLPSDVFVESDAFEDRMHSLTARISFAKTPDKTEKIIVGEIWVSDCDQEQVMSSSAAPEPAPEPDSDVEQPVSDLKAVFHFANSADTFGCPFMQVVDVAGVADNADVSLKFSIDGTPVEHTAEFTTEDEYVQEGFDGYFDLVAGDNFDATLEGDHTLRVEVSDGVGSVTIEGKFTADSC